MHRESACYTGDSGSVLGLGRSLEEDLATHSSILTWRIPWTEEPGRLQSIWSQRVGHSWSDLACTHSVTLQSEGHSIAEGAVTLALRRHAWKFHHLQSTQLKHLNHWSLFPSSIKWDFPGLLWELSNTYHKYLGPGPSIEQVLCIWLGKDHHYLKYWVDQNVCLGFSIRWYRNTQLNFLANPIFGVRIQGPNVVDSCYQYIFQKSC